MILVGFMLNVHSIIFSFRIVIGAPPPIFAISDNISPWFIDTPGFNIVNSLNKNIVGVPYFIVGAGLGYVTSYYLDCYKDRSLFFSNLYIQVVSEIILVSLGSVLVHYFVANVLLYLSVAFWLSSYAGTSVTVYQSSFILSMKLLNVEFSPNNISLNMWQT